MKTVEEMKKELDDDIIMDVDAMMGETHVDDLKEIL